MSQEFQSTAHSGVDSHILVDHSVQAVCALCQKILSHHSEAAGDLETSGICGDCNFLFSEDLDTPSRGSRLGRLPRRRRTRYSSSESSENTFSQQFSQVINLVRQNQSTISAYEDFPVEGDLSGRLLQHPSSRTTPRGSRRWRRVLISSDAKSEDSDNLDSLFADSESNVSFSWHKAGDSDAISCSTYGGDSDASVDLHGFLDSEMFTQPIEGGEFDSDTDIDPMHVGLNHWNSDDLGSEGEAEDEGDGEWEEGHVEEDMIPPTNTRSHIRNFSYSSRSERMGHFSEPDDTVHLENREGNQTYNHNIIANLDTAWMTDVGESTNYLDARGLEEFLQHLVEDDNSRLGAPPRELSFVNSLPRVIINEEHEKQLDGLACAICKDMLAIGVEVNQLPCKHLYHPSCILPWLHARNSCPLCRYELPIDDKDYEEGKHSTTISMEISTRHLNVTEDSFSSSSSDRADEELEFNESSLEQRELQGVEPEANNSRKQSGGRRWFFLAAAPVVGLVGIVLVLWLGNSLGTERRGSSSALRSLPQHNLQGASSNGRENRSRRWWLPF